MRLAELSRASGVPRSAIKFYLREGVLFPGEASARNQATYGPAHLERLALIRALRELGGLPIEVIARVTRELERGWKNGDPIGEALAAIYTPKRRRRSGADEAELAALRREVRALLKSLPWSTDGAQPSAADELAETLLQIRRHLFPGYPVAALEPIASVAWLLSEVEFAGAPGGARVPLRAKGDDLAEPTRRAIVGSVLFDRVFGTLHRVANAARSIRISEGNALPPAAPTAAAPSRARRGRRTRRGK